MTVFVVTGPPAGGKSTWVRERAKPGDIVIDYDTLAATLSPGAPHDVTEQSEQLTATVMAARDAAFNQAVESQFWERAHDRSPGDVYLVHAMPDRHAMNRYRKYGFTMVTVEPGFTECMRRATAERTPRQQSIVRDWYYRRGLAAI